MAVGDNSVMVLSKLMACSIAVVAFWHHMPTTTPMTITFAIVTVEQGAHSDGQVVGQHVTVVQEGQLKHEACLNSAGGQLQSDGMGDHKPPAPEANMLSRL